MATIPWCFTLALFMVILLVSPNASIAKMNVIDKYWGENPLWRNHQQQLATCSVGFAEKMTNNISKDVRLYKVTDPSDDPLNPKLGTLRHGATMIEGKVWITFKRNMNIILQRPLLISSFTATDGRGVDVHITGADFKVIPLGQMDGDAIRLVTAKKVWIDHNTLYECQDGLLDVTRGSMDVTISNNWFRNQEKVVLLGHYDGHLRDRNMKATVIFNHFRPNCNQRIPRVQHGLAHVANNLYQGWEQHAIGGSMSPSIKSQANYFIAPKLGNKEVIPTIHILVFCEHFTLNFDQLLTPRI
ncbi:hypothetical protein PTKIN_Ptkin04bG0142700 [Pterospermum kingtungense]